VLPSANAAYETLIFPGRPAASERRLRQTLPAVHLIAQHKHSADV